MSLQLKIEYPETLPDALQETREQFEQEAKSTLHNIQSLIAIQK